MIFLIFCCWFFFFLLLKIGALCFSLNSIIFFKFILFIFFTFILLQCFGLFSTSSLFRALHSSCVSLTGKTNLKQPGKIKSASQTRAQQVDLTFLYNNLSLSAFRTCFWPCFVGLFFYSLLVNSFRHTRGLQYKMSEFSLRSFLH